MQTAEAQKETQKIEPVFDEDEVPTGKLDDAEIARLVSLSSQAAYNRTDNIPVKLKESFQPRTLVTIAMEAQRRREAALQESDPVEDASTAISENVEVTNTTESSGNLPASDIATKLPKNDDAIDTNGAADMVNEDVSLSAAGGVEGNEAELTEEEIAAAATAEKLRVEYERGLVEGQAKGQEAGHKAGYDKGYESGRAAGQAEATAQLETAIQGFEKATLALVSSSALDLDAISVAVHETILSLASERAGMAIVEMPVGFASRIEALLATIKKGADHPQISLNPDDLLALKPIIETREKLQNCNLNADDTLRPGDVRLVIDGIGIEDEMHRRVSQKANTKSADALFHEGLTSDAGAEKDITEQETTELIAVESAESASAEVASRGDDEIGENSAASEADGKGGFSVGLKPIAKAEGTIAQVEEGADEDETDQ